MTFALFNSNIVLQTKNEIEYLGLFLHIQNTTLIEIQAYKDI